MLLEYLRILATRQRLVSVGFGVVDLAVGDLEHRRDVEVGVRGHEPVLERSRDRDRLERRAGLVVEADGLVLIGVRRRGRRIVGVDAWPVGERQDRARVGVHHDRCRALGRVLRADPGQHLLDLVLERGVDRQPQRLARAASGADVVDRDRLSDRVVDDRPQPVGPFELVVVLVLESARALAVTVHEAQQLRGEPVPRVHARDLGDLEIPLICSLHDLRAPCRPGAGTASGT